MRTFLLDHWVVLLIVVGLAVTVCGIIWSLAVAAKRGDAPRGLAGGLAERGRAADELQRRRERTQ